MFRFCLSAHCRRRASAHLHSQCLASNETRSNYGLTRKSLHSNLKIVVEGEPPWHVLLRRRQQRERKN